MLLASLLFLCKVNGISSGIHFDDLSLAQALDQARSTGKLVFVDTYASWCAPCKQMDRVFEDEQLGEFMNQHFINIKVDMDGPQGNDIYRDYNVIFLPTLLVLDQNGQIVSKVARIVDAPSLLAISRDALNGGGSMAVTALNQTPFPTTGSRSTSADYDPSTREEVIYIHDKRASSGRPHIMYHEAYLHLQLMDGKHQRVVKKYLSTQEDWLTEKNIRFIFDFLLDVHSELFDFFIANQPRFIEVIGQDKVDESLSYLIHQRIEQGYPRPNLNEVIQLFEYQDPKTAESRAYRSFLDNHLRAGDDMAFLQLAETYLESIHPYDHEVTFRYTTKKYLLSREEPMLEDLAEKMVVASVLSGEDPEYLFLTAQIYQSLEQIDSAMEYGMKSLEAARQSGLALDKYQKLVTALKNL